MRNSIGLQHLHRAHECAAVLWSGLSPIPEAKRKNGSARSFSDLAASTYSP